VSTTSSIDTLLRVTLVAAVVELVHAADWNGTATALLGLLSARVPAEVRLRPGWPANARALAALLRKLDLSSAGIQLGFSRTSDVSRQRIIHLSRPDRAPARKTPVDPVGALLGELHARKVDLAVREGRLHYRGPVSAITPALVSEIDQHTPELIARLEAAHACVVDPVARRFIVLAALRDAFARLDTRHPSGLLAVLRRVRTVSVWQVDLQRRAAVLDEAARTFLIGADELPFRNALADYEDFCRQALEAVARYDRRPGFALGCTRCGEPGPVAQLPRAIRLCERCRGLS